MDVLRDFCRAAAHPTRDTGHSGVHSALFRDHTQSARYEVKSEAATRFRTSLMAMKWALDQKKSVMEQPQGLKALFKTISVRAVANP